MKVKKISAPSFATDNFSKDRSVVGLSRIVIALLISVVLSGLAAAQPTGCPLNSPGGNISHIVYIQFDNLHLERDNPNVPSDLEQMPNLYNFITGSGTLFNNHHTPLIAHTADDILTSLTGVYPDRHGQAVANSFVAQNPPNQKYWDVFPSSFTYWTDPVETSSSEDTAFSMITAQGLNAPAPWVPFTRLGCNFGAVSIANMEMENTSGDIIEIYGKSSPQYAESSKQAAPDFEGIAIHCAQGSSLCTSTSSSSCTPAVSGGIMAFNGVCAEPDNLPSEPGGYSGYMGLFGHVYVVPAICPSCPISNGRPALNDLNGNPMTGFPGFGPISPAQALAYDAQMLENGVPIVYTYISDAHDCHSALPTCTLSDGYTRALGPGEPPYETQLQAYNAAFGAFFTRLTNDGITPANTLFIISADEQDHFVGGPASPAGCDGVNTPCTYTYPTGYTPVGNDSPAGLNLSIGEVEGDLTQLYQQQFPSLIPPSISDSKGPNSGLTASGIFDYHYDMAPAVSLNPYLASNTASFARQLERATAKLTAPNPITGNTDHLTNYLVDNAGLNALHMITGDPARTPTFVMFGNPDWYFQEQAEGTIVEQPQDYAWNHGGVAPEINHTWVGFVGPGVENNGVDTTTWSDHTDIRPTILYLTGLTDDYQSDGRVLVEDLNPAVLPAGVQSNLAAFEQLAAAYKQLNAPIGAFGQAALQGSTVALASGSPGNDSQYTAYENNLTQLTSQRNALATQIRTLLNQVEFQGAALSSATASSLTAQAHGLTVQSQLAVLGQNESSVSFGSVNVGTAASPQTLTYNFASPTTLSAVSILTDGQSGLDYTSGGGTCAAGTAYLSGQSCTVTVAFTPSAPGLRSGAVALFAQGSNVPLAIWYLSGTGQSSAVTIDAGTQTTLTTLANSGQGSGVAVDGAGNVYVVDNANSQIFELAAGTFASSTVVASGLSSPTAIALDGAGNLYISDTGNNRVALVPNEQGTLNSADMTSVSITGLGSPSGLAVDGSGNLYVADSTNGNILEIPAGGAAQLTVVSSLTAPQGVAVDGSGNIYASGNSQVAEYPSGGGAATWTVSGLSSPGSLAVDASGAVYVASSTGIVRIAPGGASQSTLPITGSNPQGLAIDAFANVYFTAGGSAYEVNRSQSALTFGNTEYGATSAPQTVTISDAGNQTLNFSNVAASANFTIVPSGGTDCTSSTTLASGLQCLVAAEFAPLTTGALSGTLTLTDNALNNAASTQSVQLTGNATDANTSVGVALTNGANPSTYGQSLTFTATLTSDTGLVRRRNTHKKPLDFSGNVTWSANTGCAASSVSGYPATATCTTAILPGSSGGSDTVTATFAGDANHNGASGSVSQTVNPASQTITFTTKPPVSAIFGTSFTVAATASSGLIPAFTTGATSGCSVVDNGNGTATYKMTSGTTACSVIVNQAGNVDYTAAPQVTKSVMASKATQTITVNQAAPGSASYGESFTIAGTASSTLTVTYGAAGACTVSNGPSGGTYTITATTGTCFETMNQSGSSNFYAAPTITESTGVAAAVAPVVSFTGAPSSAAYGTSFTVTATSNETGNQTSTAVISATTTPCSVSNEATIGMTTTATVTMLSGSGTCDLKAAWAANNAYKAASATQMTSATKVTPVVSFTGAPGSAAKNSTFMVTASSNETGTAAKVPTITATPSSVCSIGSVTDGGTSAQATVTVKAATGTCTTKASWAASGGYTAASATQTTTAN